MPPLLYPEDLGDDLSKIRAQLKAALVLARSSAAKTVMGAAGQALTLLGQIIIKGGGRLIVENAVGNALLYAGQIPLSGGGTVDGLAVFRPNGNVALAAFQSASGFVPVIYDNASNRLVMPDEAAGQGLAYPFVPLPVAPNVTAEWAPVTSAGFVEYFQLTFFKQHANARVFVRVVTPASTTAEVDLYDKDNSASLGSFTIAAGLTTGQAIEAAVPGDHLTARNLAVRARRTAGAGTVLVDVMYAYGVAS